MKIFIKIIPFFLFLNSFSQSGLDIDLGYEQRINDLKKQRKNLDETYKLRNKNIEGNYKKALDINNYSTNPKSEPSSGWYDCLLSNTYDIAENVKAYVENGIVQKITLSSGSELIVIKGGKIKDFKTAALFNNNNSYYLYFNILIQY